MLEFTEVDAFLLEVTDFGVVMCGGVGDLFIYLLFFVIEVEVKEGF